MQNFLLKLTNIINKRVDNYGAQYTAFAIFGLYNYIPAYFGWMYILGGAYLPLHPYQDLTLRLIATVLCLILLFWKYWPKKFHYFLPLYWYLTLLYCLPFFFSFILVKTPGSITCIMAMVQITLFLILLVDWLSCLILLAIGISAGILWGYLTVGKLVLNPAFDYLAFSLNYIFSIFLSMIFAHRKQTIEKTKLQTMKSVGTNIAHELRTPLLTIRAGVSGAKDIFEELVEVYHAAKREGIASSTISPVRLQSLFDALDNVEAESRFANTIINMLLIKVNHVDTEPSKFQTHAISEIVNLAMQRYPFSSVEQRNLVIWERKDDFLFKGIELFVIHVLFNLLKNSLYYIEAAGQGRIHIWYTLGKKFNYLHFKDTGKGISKEVVPHIFDQFYSKTHNGTGIGLFFCKMVMKGLGGDIICQSEEGKFAEFILSFPIVEVNLI